MKHYNRKILLAINLALALGCSGQAIAADKNAMNSSLSQEIKNARMETQIWTTYALNPSLRTSNLAVSVVNSKATLTGSVEDNINKELASEIALGVKGVSSVDNKIKVDPEYKAPKENGEKNYGDRIDDASITAAVKSKLLWSKHTEGVETKVTTNSGKVTLTGNVNTQVAKEQAGRLAKNTDGVLSVDNNLVLIDKNDGKTTFKPIENKVEKTTTAMADSWITTKVKSTFLYSNNVAGTDISVNTSNGIVTLSGKVDSGAEQALAIELAQNIRGVKSVQSKGLTF